MIPKLSRVEEARSHVLETLLLGRRPGTSVSVKVTAEELGMSPTPVREALERLVGEGVLVAVPARHGFAVPRLTLRDLTGLHALFGTLLQAVARGVKVGAAPTWSPNGQDPVGAVREATVAVCKASRMPIGVAALQAADMRLVSHRLVEPAVLGGRWRDGLIELRSRLAEGGPRADRAIAAFIDDRISSGAEIIAATEDLEVEGSR